MAKDIARLYRKLEKLLESNREHTLDMYNAKDGTNEYYFHQYRKNETNSYIKKIKSQIRELERQGVR